MSQMIRVTLPDGSAREVARGTTPAQIAADIGPGLAKAALAAKIDGELRDIKRPLEEDTNLALVTSRDEADALELVRHDFAHVLAEAVQNLFPGTQITFGPSTNDGFYYDFAPTAEHGPFRDDELPLIEEEMRKIIAADLPLTREVWERDRLIAKWQAEGETFKAEWAQELPEGEELTVYRSGNGWMDMCRGPHLASTGKLDPAAFKLTRVSGAYWRGDQKNAQLSRIYGTGWLNKKQLAEHLVRLEEAAKRDHRKIGREMDLFHLQEEAHGSVFWHPKGYRIYRELEAYMRRAIDGAAYQEVKTPQVMDARQWEQSGHWGKYRENMFVIPDEVPNIEDDGPIVSDHAEWMGVVNTLEDPNSWWRETAHRLIYERQDRSAAPALRTMLAGSRFAVARLHALYSLAGLVSLDDGDLELAMYGTFLPVPSLRMFAEPQPIGEPGQLAYGDGAIEINPGRPVTELDVRNTGDRPIQVGSHYPFADTNKALVFDRARAVGLRLDIPAGTAVRFEPGDEKRVRLVPVSGGEI